MQFSLRGIQDYCTYRAVAIRRGLGCGGYKGGGTRGSGRADTQSKGRKGGGVLFKGVDEKTNGGYRRLAVEWFPKNERKMTREKESRLFLVNAGTLYLPQSVCVSGCIVYRHP